MNWPIGMGQNFKGVFDLATRDYVLLGEGSGLSSEDVVPARGNSLAMRVPQGQLAELQEQLSLVEGALPEFSLQSYREGHLTPVFFGSALRNFGVRALLDGLAELRPLAPAAAERAGARWSRARTRSPASCSRSRPTWTPSTATGWRSCACARAASSAA